MRYIITLCRKQMVSKNPIFKYLKENKTKYFGFTFFMTGKYRVV